MKSLERERRTPEQDDEDAARHHARMEWEEGRGDYLRDEQKDRECEELRARSLATHNET